jgi:hypothetical protein
MGPMPELDEGQASAGAQSAPTRSRSVKAAVMLPLSRSMRWGIPVLVLTAIEALPPWSAARTRSRASEPLLVRGSDGAAAGRPGEEPRSVSDTRGGTMSEPMLDAAGCAA